MKMKSFDWRLNENAMDPTMWMGDNDKKVHIAHILTLIHENTPRVCGGMDTGLGGFHDERKHL